MLHGGSIVLHRFEVCAPPLLARALAGHGGSAMSRHVNVIQRKRRLKDVGITATGIATEEKRPNADRIQVR